MTEKINIGDSVFISPMVQTILGTDYKGKPNFMALGWAMRVNHLPCLIGVGVHKSHASHTAIVENGQFSVCFPTDQMTAVTDYVGLVSAERTDKSEVFEVFKGELDKAPMIKECPLCFECTLHTTVELPTNTFFIGEVKGVWTEEQYLTNGQPDVKKINPFFLSMPDNQFWSAGELIGRAWHDGKALKKSME